MKNHRLLTGLVIFCGFGLMLSATASTGAPNKRVLTEQQLNEIVHPGLHTCQHVVNTTDGRVATSRFNPDYVLPPGNAQQVSADVVKNTLHGIWRGVVEGDHGEVNVDYVWIVDIANDEGLVLASRSGSPTLAESEIDNPPTFTFLLCESDSYTPPLPEPQMHVFTKVSYDLDDMQDIVEEVTGVEFRQQSGLTLNQMWTELVTMDYFVNMTHLAFGAALFKPLHIGEVPGQRGPDEIAVGWDAQYMGGGDTLIQFEENVPFIGTEQGQFVATTTGEGTYLVASPGNGRPWKVETYPNRAETCGPQQRGEACSHLPYDLEFPETVFGPLDDF